MHFIFNTLFINRFQRGEIIVREVLENDSERLKHFFTPLAYFSPLDKIDDELEMTTVCYRPEGLDQLEAQTNFSKQELQILYRGFKNVITHILNLLLYSFGVYYRCSK